MNIEYTSKIDRKEMAKFLAYCMGDSFDPYMPNDDDDTFWTVDRGNNWKVKFFDEKTNEMQIIHRYDVKEAVTALATWVVYRTGGKLVKDG